jgi:hypothetical protein
MPLRAFLLFLLAGIFFVKLEAVEEFEREMSQCPSGHFCYFFMRRSRRFFGVTIRLNAPLPFASLRGLRGHFGCFFLIEEHVNTCPFILFQCPSGHFCYFFASSTSRL